MNAPRISLVALALAVAGLVMHTAFWQTPAPPAGEGFAAEKKPGAYSESSTAEMSGKPLATPSPASPAPSTAIVLTPALPANKQMEKWRTIAKGTYLPLVDIQSVTLSKGVIALLDLAPADVALVDQELARLMERLKSEELARAYVLVESDGSEKIAVAPFDRRPLLDTFRTPVAAQLGADVADFCVEQMFFDSTLAVGSAEVRLYTEPGIAGRENFVVSRGVHHRNSTGNPQWEGDAAPPLVNKTINKNAHASRYGHLLSAAGSLPRKTAPPK